MAVKSILIVCRGNICRSPMAEGFFNRELNNHSSDTLVTSAGITALVDYPADPNAQKVMQEQGIDISTHRARQLTDELARKANLILVMSNSHLQFITRHFVATKGKTFLLGHWRQFEVPDPYTQPHTAFEHTYDQINLAWQDWKTRILSCQMQN